MVRAEQRAGDRGRAGRLARAVDGVEQPDLEAGRVQQLPHRDAQRVDRLELPAYSST